MESAILSFIASSYMHWVCSFKLNTFSIWFKTSSGIFHLHDQEQYSAIGIGYIPETRPHLEWIVRVHDFCAKKLTTTIPFKIVICLACNCSALTVLLYSLLFSDWIWLDQVESGRQGHFHFFLLLKDFRQWHFRQWKMSRNSQIG